MLEPQIVTNRPVLKSLLPKLVGTYYIAQISLVARTRFDPWIGKIPWKRKWQPTPVFLPGKSHGQRSLAGYSPWGRKESDMTEKLNTTLYNISVTTSLH